ncbi:MAG TPA: hypothetical protein VNO30_10835 [Kofleriaceae bacterium]|nr:hypothetical protein [Kofleriaceae bacterium]
MRAFALPRIARAAWLVLVLAPAVALAAPKGRPAKKAPAKKAPVAKPSEPPEDAPAPDAEGDAAKDPRAPTASGNGGGTTGTTGAAQPGGGGAGGGPAAKKTDPAAAASDDKDKKAEPAAPAGGDEKPADGPDVDALRQEYLSLRDEVFRSRARANAVASQLYSTRMQIKLTYTSGRYYSPLKSQIRLDGAVVYEDTKGSIAGDDGIRFDGYVAPGRHLITFRVEAVGKDDDSFASTSESQITVKAVADKDLIVAAKAKDGGDIAYEWKKKEKGSYGLAFDVAVKTQPRAPGEAKGGGAAAPAAKGAK